MKKLITLAIVAVLFIAVPIECLANITIENASITAIYGTDNPDGGWQETIDTPDNIQLGIRAKETAPPGLTPNNGAGNYTPTGNWNLDFSLNTGGSVLSADPPLALTGYGYWLMIDGTTIVPLALIPDNAYGNNSTPNGGGSVGPYASFALIDNIMQNSEPGHLFGSLTGPHIFDLFVTGSPADDTLPHLADDAITVNVTPVPEVSTCLAGALLLLPLGFTMAQRKFWPKRLVTAV